MNKINVITIDGPSASGKGSLARELAKTYNLSILDSGSLYRLYAYFAKEGIKSKNGVTVYNCSNIETSFPKFKDIMNSLGMNINEKN